MLNLIHDSLLKHEQKKQAWNPAETREKYNLKLTADEKERILENFHPLDPAQLKADGVFEGGGVLGLAFLGALRCCEEIGIKWCDLAGTSAGAITASLLAVDYSIDELEPIMGELDYTQFLSKPKIIMNADGTSLVSGLASLLEQKIRGNLGQYCAEPFEEWIENKLKDKGITSFGDLEHKKNGRKLQVIASDITKAEMLELPKSLNLPAYAKAAPNGSSSFSVAKAVRMSMSIPLFFEPFKLNESIVVDGGVVSNFPLWIFDAPVGELPKYPTFGFRLMDTNPSPQIDDPVDMVKALIRAMRYAHDTHYIRENDMGRIVNIDLTDIKTTATQFDLDHDAKDELYHAGYQCTKQFFLHKWNWENHLIARKATK
jgi:NTE family protein